MIFTLDVLFQEFFHIIIDVLNLIVSFDQGTFHCLVNLLLLHFEFICDGFQEGACLRLQWENAHISYLNKRVLSSLLLEIIVSNCSFWRRDKVE